MGLFGEQRGAQHCGSHPSVAEVGCRHTPGASGASCPGLCLLCVLGVDFRVKNLLVDNKTFALQLWDTAGQERYSDGPCQWSGTSAGLRVWEERVTHKLGDRRQGLSPLKQ